MACARDLACKVLACHGTSLLEPQGDDVDDVSIIPACRSIVTAGKCGSGVPAGSILSFMHVLRIAETKITDF